MLRKLLTLLAVCAGLAAVAEPARAAVPLVESVHMLERSSAPCATRAAASQAAEASLDDCAQQRGKGRPKPTVIVVVPAVMLKADRAHE